MRDKEIDLRALQILTQVVLKDLADKYGEPGSKLQKQLVELFGRATSKIATNAELWHIYGTLHGGLGNKEKELDCLLKMVRSSETAGWEKDTTLFEKVAKANTILAKAYLESNDTKHIYSANCFI